LQSKALLKPAVFALCLLPLAGMVGDAFTGGLGVNPVEAVTHRTGDWTLRLLLATLALTPLRRLSGWSWPSRVRRMVGLFVFFYACLHLATYLWLDQFFDWGAIVVDVGERPFITVGMLAFLGLLPLAVTSNRAMQRRLGRRWKALHRLVYPVAILGVLHFWWLVKADVREPLVYALILATLLGYRLAGRLRGARERARERLST